MATLKPAENVVRYSLAFHEDVFENDECAFDSSTPFLPINVGDYISPLSAIPAVEGHAFRVTAVKHIIKQYGSEITHDVHVCVEAQNEHVDA